MDRKAFFESVANKWDGWNERAGMAEAIQRGLDAMDIQPHEHVLDLGCGTGILLAPLLTRLGPDGRVSAVDFSPRMVELARSRVDDRRVVTMVADACTLPLETASLDRSICFSTWPHFPNPHAVLQEMKRLLKPNGWFHVWHVAGRERINAIHAEKAGAVGADLLIPGRQLAQLAESCGFRVQNVIDETDRYLVTVRNGLA